MTLIMRANELITQSLRLINVPGQGARLSGAALSNGFDSLVDLVSAESVSKHFQTGTRQHFFNLQSGKSIYSYGATAQADLRSDDFDDDPAPVRIEDAYIRSGSNITNNEQIDEYRFENTGNWSTTGVTQIVNNAAEIDGIGTLTQSLGLTAGKTYTLRLNLDVNNNDVVLQVQENAVDILNITIDESGDYEYDFTFTTTLPTITFTTADAADDIKIHTCSIIERGKDRLELPDDGTSSDYHIKLIDQINYNRRYSKGTSGRPYELFYDRQYEKSLIKFDNSAIAGDILVMDVTVNRITPNSLTSIIKVHGEANRWLRYALANDLAGEHGKALTKEQKTIMNESWDRLVSGNRRINNLGVDPALRQKKHFDINRGDP